MNPTKKQVQTVIDTLTAARNSVIEAGFETCPVDMSDPYVHSCGTPMCHGGYYAVVNGASNFEQGADIMAMDLGFENKDALRDWADENPDIWGNAKGWDMFSSEEAFGKPDGDIEDLQVIIDHWKGVQSRLPE